MNSNTLDDLGRATLERLEDRRVSLEELESALDTETSRDALEERLSQLVDNALVRQVEDEYEITDNGRRVLEATPIGARDHRIDTPAHVERTIEAFSLQPDEEAAVRAAFSFLHYWGDATTAELLDGTYSEQPAGYDSAASWWEGCIEERLAALPDVRFSPNDAGIGLWHYDGDATIDAPDDEDGRAVLDTSDDGDGSAVPGSPNEPSSFGSVRHGLEALALDDDERRAARVAFAALSERETATTAELTASVYGDYPAGYDSREAWANWLADVFDALPGVERRAHAEDAVAWVYRSSGS